MTTPLLLRAVATGPKSWALEQLRRVLDLHGWVEDVHFYSGVMIAFQLELRGAQVAAFAVHLRQVDVFLDAESEAALAAWARAHTHDAPDLAAILNASFPSGDPDVHNEIPRVPG